MPTRTATTLAAVGALLVTLAVAGCSSSAAKATGTTAGATGPASLDLAAIPKDAQAAALLPASAGSTITVGSQIDQTQLPYVGDPGTTGLQADLRTAMGHVLGVSFATDNTTFAQVIPGVQDGKYQVGMSNFGVTRAREQVVDFVTYLNDGQSLVEASSDDLAPITGPAQVTELCGKTVATAPGTTFQQLITDSQPRCQAAGKPAIKLDLFDQLAEEIQALQEGRADVFFGPTAGNRYIAAHTAGLKFLSQYSTTPVGFVFAKGSPLEKPFQAAINVLIADGEYAKILAHWSVGGLGVATSQINPAPNF